MPLTIKSGKCKGCGKGIYSDNKSGFCQTCARKNGARHAGAPSSAERSKFKLCGAKKRTGGTCRLYAGQGTDHVGYGRCRKHERTEGQRVTAIQEQAKDEMVKLGAPIDITPQQAVLGLLRMTAGHVSYLHDVIGKSEKLKPGMFDLYSSERDRLLKIASVAMGNGLSEQMARAAVVQAISAAVEGANLDEDSRRRIGRELRRLGAESEEDPDTVWD